MAKAYYFDYIGASDAFKNSTVEADTIGGMFLECVYTTLKEYGIRLESYAKYKDYMYRNDDRFRGSITYDNKNGLYVGGDDAIDVSLKTNNKLIVDFKVDPLISENSNDEIIEDIRKKAEAAHLITNVKAIETASENSHNSLSAGRGGGGCYVATAVYGSYDCPEVWVLRRFRDLCLSQSWYGRAFIRIYYAISPTLVKFFGETRWFKHFWKSRLDRLAISLKHKGYSDSPYDDC